MDEPLAELADPAPSDTDAFATVVCEQSETAIDDGDESREVEAAAEPRSEEEEQLIDPVPAAIASPVSPAEEVTF